MDSSTLNSTAVAPFRRIEFRERAEFDEYMRHSEALRGNRWLYEQSLATLEEAVVLRGTCGLCLTATSFTASTRTGEAAAGGRVPNWREELVCDCRQRLSNRQRALLHYLLATGLLHPWSRVLGLGGLGALLPVLTSLSQQLTCWSWSIDQLPGKNSTFAHGHHLVISMEQLDAGSMQPHLLCALSAQLVDGGRLVFTTPFDVTLDKHDPDRRTGPVGWGILPSLRENGFVDAKACLYWSEEFGYLGPLNFIFEASK